MRGLLEVGANLIAMTVEERVVGERLTGLGLDYRFNDEDLHEDDEGGAEAEAMQQKNDDDPKRKASAP